MLAANGVASRVPKASAQLGGDFIVDADGIVRLAYRSENPTDRAPVPRLMNALRRISEERVA